MPYGDPVLGPSAAHMALLPTEAPPKRHNSHNIRNVATVGSCLFALDSARRYETRIPSFRTYQAEVDEAKKDRIALSIYGKTGKLLGRWKCADDWLLMLIVAPLLENKGKPQAMNLLRFTLQSLPVRAEGAAPKNAGTYQDPLTPGWGVIAQRIGKPLQISQFYLDISPIDQSDPSIYQLGIVYQRDATYVDATLLLLPRNSHVPAENSNSTASI
ncbi:hypothetical protein NA56DRAFT_696464 [Hyaloscypha hepaticicola]|uniref:Uncharacterized protein n=1 Tax=Hyaloscypha hepaticicola TaxID=2082293 RepID=A0A2J6QR08_9HELO|nr:hypothetical protein NA56DRAFT_696464 [Hyaloscypha hepaticicola]